MNDEELSKAHPTATEVMLAEREAEKRMAAIPALNLYRETPCAQCGLVYARHTTDQHPFIHALREREEQP